MTDINKIVPRNGYLVDGETGEKVLFNECDLMKHTRMKVVLVFAPKPLILVFVRTEVGHGMQY